MTREQIQREMQWIRARYNRSTFMYRDNAHSYNAYHIAKVATTKEERAFLERYNDSFIYDVV